MRTRTTIASVFQFPFFSSSQTNAFRQSAQKQVTACHSVKSFRLRTVLAFKLFQVLHLVYRWIQEKSSHDQVQWLLKVSSQNRFCIQLANDKTKSHVRYLIAHKVPLLRVFFSTLWASLNQLSETLSSTLEGRTDGSTPIYVCWLIDWLLLLLMIGDDDDASWLDWFVEKSSTKSKNTRTEMRVSWVHFSDSS